MHSDTINYEVVLKERENKRTLPNWEGAQPGQVTQTGQRAIPTLQNIRPS